MELTTARRLEDVGAPEWDALVRAMPRPSPFLLQGWVTAWWQAHGDGAELAVQTARRDGRLVGVLPLCVRRRHGLRVAEFLGGRDSHLADVLLAETESRETATALLAGVDAAVVDLYGLPGDSRLSGLTVVPRVEAPVLDLVAGWERAYEEKFSTKTRQTHRRKRRRLDDEGPVEFRVLEGDEIGGAIDECLDLHALRWQGGGDASGHHSPAGRAFVRSAYVNVPEARLAVLRLDGRAVAFNGFLELQGVLYSHMLAYEPALARFSPGLLCTLAMLGAVDVRRVEWLGGTEEYKLQLMDRFEPLHQGIGRAHGLGRLYAAARLGAVSARVRLKRSDAIRRLYLDFARRR